LARILVAIALIGPRMAEAGDRVDQWCHGEWYKTSASVPRHGLEPDYSELLKRWKSYEERCSGTVVYEARLAMIYAVLGDAKEAERVLGGVDHVSSPYGYMRDFARLAASYFQLWKAPSDEGALEMEGRHRAFLKSHPDLPDAQAQFGVLLSINGKDQEAVSAFEAALRFGRPLGMELAAVYRGLTISYEAVGRHLEAANAGNEAVTLRDELWSDRQFVYALSRALVGAGELKGAEDVLKQLLGSHPEVRNDPDFGAAARYLNTAKLKAKK
jgi:tetratricopeptide (TPR) repeat protein